VSIGILGGTFDPPHQAHCEISIRAINQYNLDKVIFIPSGNPWQKTVATSFLDRYNMTNLLIDGYRDLEVSNIEQDNKQPTFTVDTLTKLTISKEELFFILGSDVAVNIKTWKNYKKLKYLTNFLIAPRNNLEEQSLNQQFPFDFQLIDGEELEMSSTKIRDKYKNGESLNSSIPEKVLNYIEKKQHLLNFFLYFLYFI
jgi:nicotinate-nucleotide adenylyltransferase